MTLRLIGAFQVVSEADHRVVHLKNKKARSLLAYLAMQSHLSAQRGTLANLLWPDCTDANARHSLRQCLVSLRKELEDVSPTLLRVESNFISLDPDLVEADAHRLLLTDGTTERPALGALLQSVRGDFLSDLQINDNFSDWASELRRRVHQKLEEILHAIDENPLTDDVTANAVAAARTLTQSEPFCEDCRRLLINLTARVHGRVRALAEYKCYAAFLRREGAGEPEAQTQELIKQIEQLPSRNAPMAQPLPQDNRDESLQSESSAVAGSSLERGSPSQTDRAALPAEDQPVSPIAQERSRPRGAIRRKPRFRWVEVASRMAAAAALILALPLFFQATGRFTHINQAEATALSTLMAEAHDDSILRTIPVAIRFQDLTGNNLLSEQLRETVSDAVSKILTVNLLADPDSASARYVLNGRIKTEPGSNVLLVDLSKSDGSLLWR
jgi:DNA-binding SARP family transcriptional activator